MVVLFEKVAGFAQRGSVGLIGGPTAAPFEGVIDLTVMRRSVAAGHVHTARAKIAASRAVPVNSRLLRPMSTTTPRESNTTRRTCSTSAAPRAPSLAMAMAVMPMAHRPPASIELFGHPQVPPVMGLAGPVGGAVLVGIVPPRPHQDPKVLERADLGVLQQQVLSGPHQIPDPGVGMGPGQFLDLGGPDRPRPIRRCHPWQLRHRRRRLALVVTVEDL